MSDPVDDRGVIITDPDYHPDQWPHGDHHYEHTPPDPEAQRKIDEWNKASKEHMACRPARDVTDEKTESELRMDVIGAGSELREYTEMVETVAGLRVLAASCMEEADKMVRDFECKVGIVRGMCIVPKEGGVLPEGFYLSISDAVNWRDVEKK